MSLGEYPSITLEAARGLANTFLDQAKKGVSPVKALEAAATAGGLTIQALSERFLSDYVCMKELRAFIKYQGALRVHVVPRVGGARVMGRSPASEWRRDAAIVGAGPRTSRLCARWLNARGSPSRDSSSSSSTLCFGPRPRATSLCRRRQTKPAATRGSTCAWRRRIGGCSRSDRARGGWLRRPTSRSSSDLTFGVSRRYRRRNTWRSSSRWWSSRRLAATSTRSQGSPTKVADLPCRGGLRSAPCSGSQRGCGIISKGCSKLMS